MRILSALSPYSALADWLKLPTPVIGCTSPCTVAGVPVHVTVTLPIEPVESVGVSHLMACSRRLRCRIHINHPCHCVRP